MDLQDKIREDIHNRIRQEIAGRRVRRGLPAGTLSGLILIAVGLLFLLDHMDVIHIGNIMRFWPMILVVIGVFKLLSEHNRVGGVVLILIGGYFQLNHLGLINLSWNSFWPLLLIVAGVLMIFSRLDFNWGRSKAQVPSDVLNEFALFGGVERRVNVKDFRGGRVEAIFGGVEVDFRSSEIEGEEAVVEVEALFGGIELTIPDHWIAVYQGQSIFGGYSDETRQPAPDVMGNRAAKTLILRGRALFGGIVVKN